MAVVIKRHSAKVCVKEMKEESVTFTKGKIKFLQNHRGWGRWVIFRGEFRSLLSKLMSTDSVVAME